MEGEWDPKRRKLSANLPVGVTEIRISVEGVDGVHKMDFSTFDCTGTFISWQDYDYPALSKRYMLQRENKRQGRKPYRIHSKDYPRLSNVTRFENPTRPPFLKGGQRPMRGRSYSPSELRYPPQFHRDTVSLSPTRNTPTPLPSQPHSPSPNQRRPQPSMGASIKHKWNAPQADEAYSCGSTTVQPPARNTSRTTTTSGPLLQDITPGKPHQSDSERNHILELPLPNDSENSLGSPNIVCTLITTDLEFVGILSTWINSKEELEQMAVSLRWDLH